MCIISGSHRGVNEIYAHLGCTETSVRNCYSGLCVTSKECKNLNTLNNEYYRSVYETEITSQFWAEIRT